MTSARPATFRTRLTVAMTSLALAVLALAGAAIYLGVRYALVSSMDGLLLTVAREELASAFDEPGAAVHVHDSDPGALSLPGASGYEKYALIEDQGRRVVVRTTNLVDGPALEIDAAGIDQALVGEASFGPARRGHEALRAIYYPVLEPAGGRLAGVVAISTRPIERTLRSLRLVLGLTILVGGIGTFFAGHRLAGRLIRPLEDIAAAAGSIDEKNLAKRIGEVSPDAELAALTRLLDSMLDRLERGFAAERRFISDASHELRSPLANLRGTAEVALRYPRTLDEYREALTVVLVESERLSRLVNELLTLTRADAGVLSLERAPCDLAAVGRSAAAAIAARSAERGVRLEVEGDSLVVSADADRLRQVGDNLLDHALRHAPEGSAIVVRTARADGRACLSVRDSGPGISAENQARVFDRFYRVDPSRQRESGGVGLGLAIARAIVEAHGGTLAIESAPGRGSTFMVAVPVPSPAAPPCPS